MRKVNYHPLIGGFISKIPCQIYKVESFHIDEAIGHECIGHFSYIAVPWWVGWSTCIWVRSFNGMASYSHMSSSVGEYETYIQLPNKLNKFSENKAKHQSCYGMETILPIICDKSSPVSSITSVNECHFRLMLVYFKYRWLSVKVMRRHHLAEMMVWSPHWCYCQCAGNLLQNDNLAHIQKAVLDIARSHSAIGIGLKMLTEWEYPIDSPALL